MRSKSLNLLKGTVKRHPDGFGFLIPDDNSFPDVYIPSSQMGTALTNDRVQVAVQKKKKKGRKSCVGSVHSILHRNKEFAIGTWTNKDSQGRIQNHNLGFKEDIFVNNSKAIPVREGDFVKAKIFYPDKDSFLKGELVDSFGLVSSSAKDDVKRTMAEYEIPFDFPKEALQEAEALPDEVTKEDSLHREDLRDRAFVTIDGATAQDFDDAIFVQKHSRFYRLYVAIADVSHYVKEDSFLDKEAFERGNSSYFPNFCSPMLPEKLSNDLCSLKPHKDRLAMVQEMDFDFKGQRIRERLYPSVIQSRQRLTYGQVQDILDGLSPREGEYGESLKVSQELANILIERHIREQALHLDIPETLILVDGQGETQDIGREQRLFSHIMIEQFMLSANKAVAGFLKKHKIHLLYRIHEKPEEEKLKSLQNFSKIFGYSDSFKSRKNLLHFLDKYREHSRFALIHKLTLRALPQARYSVFNKGHYGLNFPSYTHFTSPIRRYCDLVIHRQVKQALSKNFKSGPVSQKAMEKIAQFISQKEQNSVKAERRVRDIKTARFLKKHVGESFSGYVSSISSFGLFVTLKPFFVEALVRFQDIRGFWETDEFYLSARNKKTSYRIQFGDEVKVLITASNVLTGKVDGKLLTHKKRALD